MKRPSCDEDPDIPKKTDNLRTDMSPALTYQSDGIFISKLIETSRIAKIEKTHLKQKISIPQTHWKRPVSIVIFST
jgi:hypothetical protein